MLLQAGHVQSGGSGRDVEPGRRVWNEFHLVREATGLRQGIKQRVAQKPGIPNHIMGGTIALFFYLYPGKPNGKCNAVERCFSKETPSLPRVSVSLGINPNAGRIGKNPETAQEFRFEVLEQWIVRDERRNLLAQLEGSPGFLTFAGPGNVIHQRLDLRQHFLSRPAHFGVLAPRPGQQYHQPNDQEDDRNGHRRLAQQGAERHFPGNAPFR